MKWIFKNTLKSTIAVMLILVLIFSATATSFAWFIWSHKTSATEAYKGISNLQLSTDEKNLLNRCTKLIDDPFMHKTTTGIKFKFKCYNKNDNLYCGGTFHGEDNYFLTQKYLYELAIKLLDSNNCVNANDIGIFVDNFRNDFLIRHGLFDPNILENYQLRARVAVIENTKIIKNLLNYQVTACQNENTPKKRSIKVMGFLCHQAGDCFAHRTIISGSQTTGTQSGSVILADFTTYLPERFTATKSVVKKILTAYNNALLWRNNGSSPIPNVYAKFDNDWMKYYQNNGIARTMSWFDAYYAESAEIPQGAGVNASLKDPSLFDKFETLDPGTAYTFAATIFTDESAYPFFAFETKNGLNLYAAGYDLEEDLIDGGIKLSPYEKYALTISVLFDKDNDAFLAIEGEIKNLNTDSGQVAEIVKKYSDPSLLKPETSFLDYEFVVRFDKDNTCSLVCILHDEEFQIIKEVVINETKDYPSVEPPQQHNYIVSLAPDQTTIYASDTLYVDVMLCGNINYTQLATEIVYDNNLLTFAGYENLEGWAAACIPVAANKVAIRSVPAMNMVTGAPCSTSVRVVTLKFTVKEGLSGKSAAANFSFASILVSPPAGITKFTTAPGTALNISIIIPHTCQYCVCHMTGASCYHECCFCFKDFCSNWLFDDFKIADTGTLAKLDIHQSCKYESTILTDESARPFFAHETKEGYELYPVDEELEKSLAESGIKFSPYQKYLQTATVAVDKSGDIFLSAESGLTLQKDDPEQVAKIVSKAPVKLGYIIFETRLMVDQNGKYYFVTIFYDYYGRVIYVWVDMIK
ncbi:MAG: hypothetical protein LBH91_04815 [Prevotellaceae bacterium]|jgi:hypothetical protein|nr:hypothetical protein [Prevotellaceae bacterium]